MRARGPIPRKNVIYTYIYIYIHTERARERERGTLRGTANIMRAGLISAKSVSMGLAAPLYICSAAIYTAVRGVRCMGIMGGCFSGKESAVWGVV